MSKRQLDQDPELPSPPDWVLAEKDRLVDKTDHAWDFGPPNAKRTKPWSCAESQLETTIYFHDFVGSSLALYMLSDNFLRNFWRDVVLKDHRHWQPIVWSALTNMEWYDVRDDSIAGAFGYRSAGAFICLMQVRMAQVFDWIVSPDFEHRTLAKDYTSFYMCGVASEQHSGLTALLAKAGFTSDDSGVYLSDSMKQYRKAREGPRTPYFQWPRALQQAVQGYTRLCEGFLSGSHVPPRFYVRPAPQITMLENWKLEQTTKAREKRIGHFTGPLLDLFHRSMRTWFTTWRIVRYLSSKRKEKSMMADIFLASFNALN